MKIDDIAKIIGGSTSDVRALFDAELKRRKG